MRIYIFNNKMPKIYETKILSDRKLKQFGITVKANHLPNPTEQDYAKILDRISKRAQEFDFIWEDQKKDGSPCKLHFHGVVKFQKIPLFHTILDGFPGFHMRHEVIYDIDGWTRYAMKNCNINNNEYMF